MIRPIRIRNVEIGTGAPKIIVPIVGKNREAILEKGREIAPMPVHMVEWRADHYEEIEDIPAVLSTLHALREILGDLPLLFTFRTKKEGGERAIADEAYEALNLAVANSGDADCIDVEIFSGDELVSRIIAGAHKAGVRVVGSNHDFFATPAEEEIVFRLQKMQAMDCDLPKIAVMPQSTQDVLTLLSATAKMHEEFADRPIITMSMSPKGVISRLSGECFGSAMTFGAVGQVSAPGQIPAGDLKDVLDLLHKAL